MGEDNANDDLCMCATDLIQSKSMQEDMTLKNTLEEKVGKLSSFVEGKSMVQLRREARKRKKVHSEIATAHLPSVDYEDVSCITPATPLGKSEIAVGITIV